MRELNYPGKENTIALWNRRPEDKEKAENAQQKMQIISWPVLTQFSSPLGCAGCRGLWRGKAQSSGTSGVTFGWVCCAAPGAFTATSVASLMKTFFGKPFFFFFFSEKTQKSLPWLPGLCDKQVAAGKPQPCTFRLPFPQHLQRF